MYQVCLWVGLFIWLHYYSKMFWNRNKLIAQKDLISNTNGNLNMNHIIRKTNSACVNSVNQA